MFKKAFILISLFCLTACSIKPKSQSTLRLNIGSDISTLDPRQASDAPNYFAISFLYDGLFRIGPDQKPNFALCQNYEISNDKKTYTFYLKKAKWANGKKITAQDFAYSWLTSLNPLNPSPNANQFFIIKNAKNYFLNKASKEDVGICIVDENTLQVTLTNPTPFFFELLSMPFFFPVNSQSVKLDANWHKNLANLDLTNGPFKLKSWVANDHLILEKNPLYWDKKKISMNTIELLMIENANTELQLFENNEIDWAGTPVSPGLPFSAIEDLKKRHLLNNSDPYAVIWFMFNTTKKPFNNEKLRRAFALSLNRQEVINYIKLQNNILPQTLFPPAFSLGKVYFKDADVEQAKKLFQEALEESDITQEDLSSIKISYYTSENTQKIMEIIQQQWQKTFKVTVELENADWPVYINKLDQRNFDVGFISWESEYDDVHYFLNIFKSKTDLLNSSGWENKTYQALLDAADLSANVSLRKDFLQRAEKIITHKMPITPLYYRGATFVANPKLKGFYFTNVGSLELAYSYFEK